MVVCKGILVVIVSLQVVIWMNLIGESEGNFLKYGAIGRDVTPGCGPMHPEECKRTQANPYTRGCLSEERCRDHEHEPDKDFGAQDDGISSQIGNNDTSTFNATDVKYPRPLGY